MGLSAALAALAAVCIASGCVTRTRVDPAVPDAIPITRTAPDRAWSVNDGEGVRGFVVSFSDPDRPDDASRRYFSVRNALHQELGSIDALGRAWRFVPHEREARWVGAGTLAEGARRILDARPEAELTEIALDELRDGGRRVVAPPMPETKSLPGHVLHDASSPRPRP